MTEYQKLWSDVIWNPYNLKFYKYLCYRNSYPGWGEYTPVHQCCNWLPQMMNQRALKPYQLRHIFGDITRWHENKLN